MRTKLRYADNISQTSGASAGTFGSEWAFRLNSLYDPDYTYTGHQPYGFDQLASLYYSYRVEGVRVRVTWSDPSRDGLYVAQVVTPSTASWNTNAASLSAISENPSACVIPLNNTGSQVTVFEQYFKIHEIEGVPASTIITSPSYNAGVTNNPTSSPYLIQPLGTRNERRC